MSSDSTATTTTAATTDNNNTGVRNKEHEKHFERLMNHYEKVSKQQDEMITSYSMPDPLLNMVKNTWVFKQLVKWGGDLDMKRSFIMNRLILNKMHDVRFYDKVNVGLEKNFQSWFNVGTLHMWMTLHAMRVKNVDPRPVEEQNKMSKTEQSRASKYESLSQELNDLYFTYVDDRVDELMANHPHRRRTKKQLSNMYMQHILSYDDAIESGKDFSITLKTNLFNIYVNDNTNSNNSNNNEKDVVVERTKDEHVAAMLKYVQTSLKQLSQPTLCHAVDALPLPTQQFVLNPTLHGVLLFDELKLPPPPPPTTSTSPPPPTPTPPPPSTTTTK
jgi:hypothetical protein